MDLSQPGITEDLQMVSGHNVVETLLNEHDVARITGLSVASVRRWRLLKQGPKFLKLDPRFDTTRKILRPGSNRDQAAAIPIRSRDDTSGSRISGSFTSGLPSSGAFERPCPTMLSILCRSCLLHVKLLLPVKYSGALVRSYPKGLRRPPRCL